ncbi:MAG: hypothetical protein LC808_36795 [Actinobacteria bacterium]|nr:hypothetical protein [Actinomycetota bacterium]
MSPSRAHLAFIEAALRAGVLGDPSRPIRRVRHKLPEALGAGWDVHGHENAHYYSLGRSSLTRRTLLELARETAKEGYSEQC